MDMDAGMPLTEITPVEDDFCMGLGRIEDLGSEARFVLYSRQTLYEGANREIFVVRRKIVLPLSAIGPGVAMTVAFLARKAVTAAGAGILRVVRREDDEAAA